MTRALLALALIVPAPLAAQRWDPDWCLTCRDSQQHFAAGAGVAIGARLVLPKARVWQRLAVAATIGLAYELGQEHSDRQLTGPGFGLGPKDLLLDIAGAALVEGVWALVQRGRRRPV